MQKRCQNCEEMICKTYYFKDELLTGYCRKFKVKTKGSDLCKIEKKQAAKQE